MDIRTPPKIAARAGGTRGFTLMEVALALLLLAGALTVLLGLQSSSISRAVRDRHQQQAMLISRAILAAIEVSAERLETQDATDAPERLIEKITGAEMPRGEELSSGRTFLANLRVDELEIPVPNKDPRFAENAIPLKQVTLTVFWGDKPADQLRTVFVVPARPKERS